MNLYEISIRGFRGRSMIYLYLLILFIVAYLFSKYISKRKIKLIPLALVYVLISTIIFTYPTEYDRIMKPAIENLNKNPNETVFDGLKEPTMPNMLLNYFNAEGIDTDKNGIRDDIDIWINRTGNNYNERMALRQLAIAQQEKLKVCLTNLTSESRIACQKVADAHMCLRFISPKMALIYLKNTHLLTFNTSTRESCNEFYIKNNCSYILSSNAIEKKCKFNFFR